MRREFLLVIFGLLLALSPGCRTRQPYLRPPIEVEELNEPPDLARYNQPGLPAEAMSRDETRRKKAEEDALKPGGGMPSMGMGGQGGGRP